MGQKCSAKRPAKEDSPSEPVVIVTSNSDDIRDDYRIGSVLGSGAFGQVRECFYKHGKDQDPTNTRAVKIMERKASDKGDWSNSAMFRREITVLADLNHDNIIKYYDFYEDKHFLYAVMEKCEGGELFEQICKRRRFTEIDAAILCRQMLLALEYIHSQNIVHRDVKAENFLFKDKTTNSIIKMIDFGMSAKITPGEKLKEVCGSPHYLAPELIRKSYDTQSDMWALGVLIFLMLYGRYPFDGKETKEIVREVIHKKIDVLWENNSQKYDYSTNAIDFMKKLLTRDSTIRMTASTALNHPWIIVIQSPLSPIKASTLISQTTEDTITRDSINNITTNTSNNANKNGMIEYVRLAQRKVTIAKPVVSKEVEERRNKLLKKLEEEFEKGIRTSHRIGRGDVVAAGGKVTRPEFSRHDKRMVTTPSRIDQSVFQISNNTINNSNQQKNSSEDIVSNNYSNSNTDFQQLIRLTNETIDLKNNLNNSNNSSKNGNSSNVQSSKLGKSSNFDDNKVTHFKANINRKTDVIGNSDGIGSLANDLRTVTQEIDEKGRRKSKRAFTALAPLNVDTEEKNEEKNEKNSSPSE